MQFITKNGELFRYYNAKFCHQRNIKYYIDSTYYIQINMIQKMIILNDALIKNILM